ncbi:acyl-CoA thioesterase [Nonomuraea soli]|uniref:Acyl-CoA thioester hydrolase n=1 Tax=Nonomuraea soli TaxID=1032476 RepID=A0A7W0HMZ2_9ACTN|nr:thioesterase family protein [Nonomuraea soli]MBA2889238.1 acyl-CoA thioester hydrolase [Nonomuraea soli]
MNDYHYWRSIPSRWNDNDSYGHLNNVVHYEMVDSTVNTWLVEKASFDPRGPRIGMCVESRCVYKAEASFPDVIRVGLRIGKLGTSSVRYELGLFRDHDDVLIAEAEFTHVFVDRVTRRPAPIEGRTRAAMEAMLA